MSCVFGGRVILWVSSIQFDIFTFGGAYKRVGVCTYSHPEYTRHTKSSSPRREFSRSLALGIGQIHPYSYPAREEPTHTRHWGKGSTGAHRDHPHFLWGVCVSRVMYLAKGGKEAKTLLTYDPILQNPSNGGCAQHPPTSLRCSERRAPKGKNLPKTKSPESLAPALAPVKSTSLVISSESLLFFLYPTLISSPLTHLVTRLVFFSSPKKKKKRRKKPSF